MPITGCKNFGGRGYARSTFIAHLNSHRHNFLVDVSEKIKALQAASTFSNLGCCALCGKLNLSATGKTCCKKCHTLKGEFTTTSKTLSHSAHMSIVTRIQEANKTHLRIISDIPPLLRRHWSRCVSTTLALFLAARTDEESLKALEAWTKLKAVLVLPPKGGTKRKRSTYKFYEKRMVQWIAGLRGECWDGALKIEDSRQKSRSAARSNGPKH